MGEFRQKGGRPKGVGNPPPQVPNWHGDAQEANERGISIPTLQRQVRLGIGPAPVKHGRHNLYPDGGFAAYLEQQRQRMLEPEPPRRGRPPGSGDRQRRKRRAAAETEHQQSEPASLAAMPME
jgi:hypothetical protein